MTTSKSPMIEIEDSVEGFYEFLDETNTGDGLPGVPPTRARVDAMLATTSRDPDELLGLLKPRHGMATIEAVARNAVMAAKQRIVQRVREGERQRIREEYNDRVGELLSGEVQQIERGNLPAEQIIIDHRTPD